MQPEMNTKMIMIFSVLPFVLRPLGFFQHTKINNFNWHMLKSRVIDGKILQVHTKSHYDQCCTTQKLTTCTLRPLSAILYRLLKLSDFSSLPCFFKGTCKLFFKKESISLLTPYKKMYSHSPRVVLSNHIHINLEDVR